MAESLSCSGQAAREAAGKEASPTAGVLDSQSVKTTESSGEHGFDAGELIKGRKWHIVTDMLGLPVGVAAHAADVQHRDGAVRLLSSVRFNFPGFRHIFADGSYAGLKLKSRLAKWVNGHRGTSNALIARKASNFC